MINNEEVKQLFKMYLEGNTNDHQTRMLFRYLKENKITDADLFDLMEDVWQQDSTYTALTSETDKDIERLWLAIDAKKHQKAQRFQLLKYAASLVLFCSAAIIWYLSQKPKTVDQQNIIAVLSKTTLPGEKIKMILPDSSIVYLGGRSKITWPASFEMNKVRRVTLIGEAFFEVKHDSNSPFIIQSGNMETQVLGTSFNIYAYPKDKEFSVTVRTGKVGVIERNQGKRKTLSLLTAGMELVYHKNDGKYMVYHKKTDDANSWITNRFVFRDESLQIILSKLERYYDVKFGITNYELANCRFNATFNNKSITEVMKQLETMTGGHLKYKISENTNVIALWGKACQ